jgi:tight adherence protein C
MEREAIIHAVALSVAFLSVSIGTYGLVRQLAVLGILPLVPGGGRTRYRELVHRLGLAVASRGWFEPQRNSVRRDLVRGRLVDVTAEDFAGESVLYAIGAGIAVWILTMLVGGAPWNVVPALVAGFVVFQVPGWNLKGSADRRIREITRRLPYSLEVVVLATEAGAGFEEALGILVREDPKNTLHEEFDQVLRDTHLGLKRREALHAMSARVATEDLVALVMALDISEDLGTPLAETLKKQAEAIRSSRLHRAERLAREAGPKMAVPNTMIMVANVLLILAPFLPKLMGISSGL